jgi:hypothetical protein
MADCRAARRRQRFLIDHPSVVAALLLSRGATGIGPSDDLRLTSWRDCVLVAQAWEDLGFADADAAFATFYAECLRRHAQADRPGAPPPPVMPFGGSDDETLLALVDLTGGRLDRALRIGFSAAEMNWSDAQAVAVAWKWLRPARLREGVRGLAARRGVLPRVVAWLARTGRCVRLPDAPRLRDDLADVFTDDAPSDAAVLAGLCADCPPLADLSEELHRRLLRVIRHNGGRLPQRLLDVVMRRSRLDSERRTLEESADVTNPKVAARLRNLRSYLDDPDRLRAWVERDLRKTLDASADEATLSAMEGLTQRVMERRVRRLAGGPPPPGYEPGDWDNAVRLYFSIQRNRGILRRLLRQEAGDKDARVRDHAANRRFLDAMRRRGIDIEVWTGRFTETSQTPNGPLTVSLETDPLKVLQMGNYFRTCLAEGGCNAFATVANACEANKRVAYVRDARGAVVGRKLLAMTAAGRILGFRSYGAGDFESWEAEEGPRSNPWVKIVLDVFCRRLADACRTTLHPFPREPEGDPDPGCDAKLNLFAQWYNDGAEAFDRWWLDQSPDELRAGVVGGGAVFDCLLAELEGLAASGKQEGSAVAGPALRAALWLGEDAAELVRSLIRRRGPATAPAAEQALRALARHALSARVRGIATAGLPPE